MCCTLAGVYMALCLWLQFCQGDNCATVQNAVIKLYSCVVMIKMRTEMEVINGEGIIAPHFMPLAYSSFKPEISVFQFQSFPSTLV